MKFHPRTLLLAFCLASQLSQPSAFCAPVTSKSALQPAAGATVSPRSTPLSGSRAAASPVPAAPDTLAQATAEASTSEAGEAPIGGGKAPAITIPASEGIPEHTFAPEITKKGWSKSPKPALFIGKDGKLNELGLYYYDLASDPKNFEAYLKWNFDKRSGNFTPTQNPVYKGTNQGYAIHRFCGTITRVAPMLKKLVPKDKADKLCNKEWTEGATQAFINLSNDRGFWEYDGNEANMACIFHFTRTVLWGVIGGEGVKRLWSIERSQKFIKTLLTDPGTFNADDQWLPASADYLHKCEESNSKADDFDKRLIKDGKAFWRGGLFIGWKDKPSLHGTWDGLSCINKLYQLHPQADPASPESIFYLWNKEPQAVKERTKRGFDILTKRLWYDYLDKKGPSYCHIVNGEVSGNNSGQSDVKHFSDNAAYDRSSVLHWSNLAWNEVFGKPSKSSRDGCQALLGILALKRDNYKAPPNWKDPEALKEVITGNSGVKADEQPAE